MVTSPAGRHLMQCKQSERYCVVLHSAPDSDLSRHSPQDSNPGLSRPCGCRPPDLDSTRPRVDKAQGRAFRSRSVLRGTFAIQCAGFENPAEQQTESLCYKSAATAGVSRLRLLSECGLSQQKAVNELRNRKKLRA